MAMPALREIEGRSGGYWLLFAVLAAVIAAGLGAAHYMETEGHVVTGMDNQTVWGLPHVFAVLLIVAASGALNVATIASVFDRRFYKPLAPLSGWLAVALLVGGLAVLALDLGRPERLTVAMTHFNFKSIFAWNMFLYSGFLALIALYLWTLLERGVSGYARPVGATVFAWRIVLTTGTGSIFGFLIAREAYASALLAPLFVAHSFAYGMAFYLVALLAGCAGSGRDLGAAALERLARLLGWCIVVVLYFVIVFHLTNLYLAKQTGVERFLLLDGGIHTVLFWLGQIALGSALPLALLWHPRGCRSRTAVLAAALLVIAGGVAQMYVTIIGAQAWPLDLFPGYEARSSFYDGEIHRYSPSVPEALLGVSGIAIAAMLTLLGVKLLKLLPESAADDALAAGGGDAA
jgi:Ni/Fe-hydrogenase subunit HybB-like protein